MSAEAQHSLGETPDKFTAYWTSRFPLLLLHSWLAMQCVKNEATFQQYYYDNFTFPERTGKETFFYGNVEAMTHFERSYNYDEYDLTENVDPQIPNDNDILWQKKQKPKPYYKYSPKRNADRSTLPYKKYQNFNNQKRDDRPSNNDWTSPDRDFRRNKAKLVNNNKNFKNDDNILWTLPTEDKKLQ